MNIRFMPIQHHLTVGHGGELSAQFVNGPGFEDRILVSLSEIGCLDAPTNLPAGAMHAIGSVSPRDYIGLLTSIRA